MATRIGQTAGVVIKVAYAIFLGGVWFALSGHTEWYILTLGGVSILLVVWLCARMAVIDREGFPVHLLFRALGYHLWLAARIIESNLAVARLITRPELEIEPSRFQVRSGARDDIGRVTYANSITLTPGTVTLAVDGAELEVHALTREAADDLATGAMDRQVLKLEGSA